MSPLLPLLTLIAIPPQIALTIRDPQVNLPKLRPALDWVGNADLYFRPARIERWSLSVFGEGKPFDAKSLASRGIDPHAPILAMLPTAGGGPLIVELAVADPKLVDASLAKLPRAKPLEIKGAPWAVALVIHPRGSRPLVLARIDHRLVVFELLDPARALEQWREVQATDRPKKGRAPLTFEIRDLNPIERATIEVELAEGQIVAKANASLGMAARMIAGDIVGERPARRYLDSLDAAASVSGSAGPGALREALIEAGMPAPEADEAKKLLSGEHAVVLTKQGTLAAAVRLSGSAAKKDVAAFQARLTQLQPGLEVRDVGGGFLLGWFPGEDQKALLDLTQKSVASSPKAEGAVELKLDPPSLISAMRRRIRTRVGPSVPSAHLTIFEALYENLLRKTKGLRVVASRSRGEMQVTAILDYQ